MKANAKKLLALILAMVMCLSLAAPAMASAVELGTQAIAVQDVALAATVTDVGKDKETFNGDYEVKAATGTDLGDTIVSGNVTNTTQPNGVEVKQLTKASHLIGQGEKPATYKVTYNGTYNNNSYTAEGTVQVGKDSKVQATLADSNVTWTALTGADMTFAVVDQQYQVKGSYYKETDPTSGKVNVFFKLVEADAVAGTFLTDEHYFAAKGMNSSDNLSAALQKIAVDEDVECNLYGLAKTGSTFKLIPGASIKANTIVQVAPAYDFVVQNAKDVIVVTEKAGIDGEGKPTTGKFKPLVFATDTDTKKQKTTGSFQVSIEDKAQEYKNKKATNDTKAVFVTDTTVAKTILVDALSTWATVNDVTAAGGNFLTVTVTALPNSEPYKNSGHSKNVLSYNGKAGLIDLSKDGWYNGDDPEGRNGSAIAAGTEFLGPVAVRENDVSTYIPTGYVDHKNGFYIYASVKAMKDGIKTDDCKNSKTVAYAQAIMNYKVNGNANVLLNPNNNLEGAITKEYQYGDKVAVTPKDDWATLAFTPSAAAFVKTGSFDVAATSHKGPIVETVESKNATCKEAGTKTTKNVCTHCNKVISEKTETLPAVSDPVKVNTDDKVQDANGKEVDQIFWATAPATGKAHYIKKAETTTVTDPTTKVTTVTTVYTCNLGVIHDELTRVVTVEKAELQHSGKWNLATWTEDPSKLNQTGGIAVKVDAKNMWGNILEIADSDVDNENLPLNRKSEKGDKPFTINNVGNAMDDGTYTQVYEQTVSVFANSKALPKEKTYLAVATVKDIKYAKADCLTGTASVQIDIYEQTDKWITLAKVTGSETPDSITVGAAGKLDTEKLAKALKDGKLTKIQTYTKDLVIPATALHKYTGGATVCDTCGTSREAAQNKSQIFTADTISVTDVVWTGKAVLPKVVVKDTDGNMLIEDVDYIMGVEDKNATDAGTYTCVIKGIGDYTGNRISKTYNINKVAATLKKKSAPSKLTASATKKVTGQIKMTVKGGKVAKYKVTKKVSGVSVNKSGKITVKKGNKKAGTLKVKVTMTPDANHTAAKAVTVKVAIKAAPAAKKTTKKK